MENAITSLKLTRILSRKVCKNAVHLGSVNINEPTIKYKLKNIICNKTKNNCL